MKTSEDNLHLTIKNSKLTDKKWQDIKETLKKSD
jgi:hypothetical protein